MVQFVDWCDTHDVNEGPHAIRVINADPRRIAVGVENTAAIVPGHYAAEEQIASAFARLGKMRSAALIEARLPLTKAIRSGDLGEIFATEWVNDSSGYRAPIKRLRWKDHRNMAMRGDDVIGVRPDDATGRLAFLKVEAKSRAALNGHVLQAAREGLDKDGGLPSPHALAFMSARLYEMGDALLASSIEDAVLIGNIHVTDVRHLIFTFTGNAPEGLLAASLRAYAGGIGQWAVGLQVAGHAAFVGAVFERVITNARNA